MRNLLLTSVAAATLASLAACGGGEDEAPGAQAAARPVAAVQTTGPATAPAASPGTPADPLKPSAPAEDWMPRPADYWTDVVLPGIFNVGLTPACDNCGAVNVNTYVPEKGVGVWKYANVNGLPIDVPVVLHGLTGQDVTLVFSNGTQQAKPMPAITLTPPPRAILQNVMHPDTGPDQRHSGAQGEAFKRQIDAFNRTGWVELINKMRANPAPMPMFSASRPAVNDRKVWYGRDDQPFHATLVRQFTTSDRTAVNIWVEDSERGPTKVSDEKIATLGQWFVGPGRIYDLLKHAGGPLWGPHALSQFTVPHDAPLDIVIQTIGDGVAGYAFAGDWFKNYRLLNAKGNESLAIHLDAPGLYANGQNGLNETAAALAHETTHMQNFYRRTLSKGPAYMYDLWLEEMTAIMMMDYATDLADPKQSVVRDNLFGNYFLAGEGMYNCGLQHWAVVGHCHPYATAGSFGAFLTRQLGMDFFRDLLHGTHDGFSTAMLDKTIRAATGGSAGLDEMFRRFTATTGGLIKAGAEPAGYGFPRRVEQGFTLPQFDPHAFAGMRNPVTQLPAVLQPLASMPVVRPKVHGQFWETVKVPQGTVLSVVVQ